MPKHNDTGFHTGFGYTVTQIECIYIHNKEELKLCLPRSTYHQENITPPKMYLKIPWE